VPYVTMPPNVPDRKSELTSEPRQDVVQRSDEQ
jgi:hypothetical protein